MGRLLVVDDEPGIRSFLEAVLVGAGHEVTTCADGEEAARTLKREAFHLLITDLKMPKLDGDRLVELARSTQPDMEVVVLTAHGTVESAVRAMKLGAFDYLTKPLSGPDELRLLAERALERRRLRLRVEDAHDEAPRHELVAVDPAMAAVRSTLEKVADAPSTVLLLGESGTGKEVAARFVHARSPRAQAPFVAVNGATLSSQLAESELFGHEKGAFTGADARRRGRFEQADGGTLFLDEIAELPGDVQAKLLRVLQERSFERLGGARTIHVDVRLIAATHQDLLARIREGAFREDLYHRLAVLPIRIPPLRERRDDVLPLAEHLLATLGERLRRPGAHLDDDARDALLAHDWPGNVRELANTLERALLLAPSPTISARDLALEGRPRRTIGGFAWDGTLRDLEREAIRRALRAADGHRKRAAASLGIGLRTLYEKIKTYGLSDED
jgi:two-component system response regulator FlrC